MAEPQILFRNYTRHVPPNIPLVIQSATSRLLALRAAAIDQVPQWETLRQTAHDVRLHGIAHLEEYVALVERQVAARGGHIHRARDAAEACAFAVEIARRHGVKSVVKTKSMATEEIDLNHALEQAGLRSYETDIGEFIIQLARVAPSHILGPTLHMTKEDIAALFRDKLGVDAPPDPRRLTDIAREQLREQFLRAEMGISGANFVVAETGTVVLLTNEGNGRLCTTLPDVYVAIAPLDKIIPDWNSLAVLLKLLARSATGQKLSCYTSFITAPCRTLDENDPREFHLILLDNGRTRIAQDPLARETLLCIRCAACLNICPVYNHAGGHAYGWTYSGPIGAILSPQLLGTRIAGELPFASSLCGACADVCPVKIPIPKILLYLRHRVAEGDRAERSTAALSVRLTARVGARVLGTLWLYRLASHVLRIAQAPFERDGWLPALPPPLSRWTQVRPFPAFRGDFRSWWKGHNPPLPIGHAELPVAEQVQTVEHAAILSPDAKREKVPWEGDATSSPATEMDGFLAEVNRLAGTARRVAESEIDTALKSLVETEHIRKAALWATPGLIRLRIAGKLRALGVEILPHIADKRALAQADLGITEADFALADSGTLGLLSSPTKPRSVSILPRVHLAIVNSSALRADLPHLFAEARLHNYLILITGPNRTSDIESTPVLGAHGPKALYVWAIE